MGESSWRFKSSHPHRHATRRTNRERGRSWVCGTTGGVPRSRRAKSRMWNPDEPRLIVPRWYGGAPMPTSQRSSICTSGCMTRQTRRYASSSSLGASTSIWPGPLHDRPLANAAQKRNQPFGEIRIAKKKLQSGVPSRAILPFSSRDRLPPTGDLRQLASAASTSETRRSLQRPA